MSRLGGRPTGVADCPDRQRSGVRCVRLRVSVPPCESVSSICLCFLLDPRRFQRREHARVPERHAAQPDAGRVENRVGDRGERRLAHRLPGAVVRQVRAGSGSGRRSRSRRRSPPACRCGVSVGYDAQSTLVTFSVSNVTSSWRARLSEWSVPPSIIRRSPSGLMTSPQSWAQTNRLTHTCPVRRFTSTSAICATTVWLRYA